MPYLIAGLGNPGEEYAGTRHNTGRIVLENSIKEFGSEELSFDKKANALVVDGEVGPTRKSSAKREKVVFVEPETFMNNSGKSIAYLVKNTKAAEKLVVVYDDFNLPIGRIRISFNRSSGGHNGVESIIKSLKTESFLRIRVGTAPVNSKGEAKTPHGEESKLEEMVRGSKT